MAGSRLRRVERAVGEAEAHTGLELCVYLGPAGEEPSRALAERLFAQSSTGAHPAALLLVAPDAHRVEIVTAPWARSRLPDAACEEAIALMLPHLRRGRFDRAVVAGVDHLAAVAGPGVAAEDATELPDVIDERDD